MIGIVLFLLIGILLTGSIVSYISPVFGDNESDYIEKNEHLTKPTFGLSHDNNKKIVDDGFSFNNQTFTITDNFHTPFAELLVNIGKVNSFDAKVYAEQGIKVQEFLFGIPQKGDAHLAELGIEVWFGLFGEIQDIKVIQKTNVIDSDSVTATHQKAKCLSSDSEENCNVTSVSMIFLEPLRDKVMTIKAIDYKNRYQITYLNEGFDVSGESLNPMNTMMIPSPERYEGLIQLTQTEKYSHYWATEDGRIFERNDFGSFKQINQSFERFQDTGEPLTRYHSGFGEVLKQEKERALNLFNATALLSQISDSYSIEISIGERITDEMKVKMTEQEQIAQKILEDSQVQARYSKHSKS